MAKAGFDIQLQGFVAANRDAVVELTNQATGQKIVRKPFLDGKLVVRDLDPGNWEMAVRHPNLVQDIDRRIVRLFPQPFPTRVPVIVPPELFRDTPIRDVPDADLSPVQQAAATVARAVPGAGGKAAGEVIRAEDWNLLVGAVGDLANAVLELTRLVSPVGHDHAEIADKIAEVQGNIRRFTETFGRSLLELRRDIENQNLRRRVTDVLDEGSAPVGVRDRLLTRVGELERAIQQPTPVWTAKLAATGNVLLQEVNELAVAQGTNADAFLASPAVRQVMEIATHFSATGTQNRAEEELLTYQRTTTAAGGESKLPWARR